MIVLLEFDAVTVRHSGQVLFVAAQQNKRNHGMRAST
jgi:hypothetical protein